jgi:hypothetical protein
MLRETCLALVFVLWFGALGCDGEVTDPGDSPLEAESSSTPVNPEPARELTLRDPGVTKGYVLLYRRFSPAPNT